MFSAEKVRYLVQLLVPVLLLPLFTVRTVVVVPVLCFNLLSTFYYQTDVRYHYTSLIIPVLSVIAVSQLGTFHTPRIRRTAGHVDGACCDLLRLSVGTISRARQPAGWYDPGDPKAVAAAKAVALIPEDAVVAARDRLSSHLTHRESVYVFPTPFSANSWGDESQKGQRLPMADEVDYVLEIPRLQSETAADVWRLCCRGFVTIFERRAWCC